MLIRDVMTKEVISVSPESSVDEVARLLIQNKIHAVPVIEEGKPIGIITETDFFTKGSVTVYLPQYIDLLKKDTAFGKIPSDSKDKIQALLETKATDIMSYPCKTIRSEDDVADFFTLVQSEGIISVPVIGPSDEIEGIITLTDIINLIDLKE
jgi:CBS domain-containing protein